MITQYQRLCMLQGRIGRLMHRVIDRRIQALGIHPSQHQLLVRLYHTGKMPSQAKLAEEMDVSPALVARTLKTLETGGYIERADSSTDGRRNEIAITEKGAQVLREGRQVFDYVDARSFEGFSDGELNQFGCLLEKMLDNIMRLERAEKEMKQN